MQKEFHDLETASSSGLSHVPSQPMSTPSFRRMISRDSCLQHDTRNSLGTSGHVFEGLSARGEQCSALFQNSKNLASSSCRLKPNDTGKRRSETRTAKFYNTNSSLCQERRDLEPLFPYKRNSFSKLYDGKSQESDLGPASR